MPSHPLTGCGLANRAMGIQRQPSQASPADTETDHRFGRRQLVTNEPVGWSRVRAQMVPAEEMMTLQCWKVWASAYSQRTGAIVCQCAAPHVVTAQRRQWPDFPAARGNSCRTRRLSALAPRPSQGPENMHPRSADPRVTRPCTRRPTASPSIAAMNSIASNPWCMLLPSATGVAEGREQNNQAEMPCTAVPGMRPVSPSQNFGKPIQRQSAVPHRTLVLLPPTKPTSIIVSVHSRTKAEGKRA